MIDNSIVSFRTYVRKKRVSFSRTLNSKLQLDHAIVGETNVPCSLGWAGVRGKRGVRGEGGLDDTPLDGTERLKI